MLSAVSFLQDTASELLYPLLPIYLTTVLGAPPAVVGAIEGAAEGAAAMTKLASGPLGDRYARRPLIATGYGLAALGKVMVAAFGAWQGVLAGRVVDRLGKGLRGAPRDALLVADVDDAARGRVFGFHRAMDTAGAVVGPLLGLAGYELLDHRIAPLLWVAVVPAVLSVALVFLVREPRRLVTAVRAGRSSPGPRPARPVLARRRALLVAFGVVNFPDALLLLRLNEIGFSVAEVILAYVTLQRGVRAIQLSGGRARRPHPATSRVRNRLGVLRHRLRRARADRRSADGLAADRRLRALHGMHRRRRQGVDLLARRHGRFSPVRRGFSRARRASRCLSPECGPACCGASTANCRC